MQLKTRWDVALYVWDYFYCSHDPIAGEERAWAAIERATGRIRESEPYLDPPTPDDERLRHARRVRNASRIARRHIEQLSREPPTWVVEGLAELEAFVDDLIRALGGVVVLVH